jgi:hypothetical protein
LKHKIQKQIIMKKQILFFGALVLSTSSFAQTWLTSGGALYNNPLSLNCGIGLTSPSYKLEVSSATVNDGIQITQQPTGSGGATLWFKNQTTGGRTWLCMATGNGNGEGAGHFNIVEDPHTTSVSRLFIKGNDNGQIGIGTVTPADKLHVIGGIRSYKAGDDYINPQLYLGNSGNSKAFSFQLNSAETKLNLWTYNSGWNNRFAFTTGGNFEVTAGSILVSSFTSLDANAKLAVNGKTQIGNSLTSSSPHISDYLLSVNGKGVFKEIYVTNSYWADFVFANDYKLPSLHDVETYYKENKHLPEIPSAKEVEANGYSVGEMNKLLLQKIEELTIYLVDQQKEIEVLKKKINN